MILSPSRAALAAFAIGVALQDPEPATRRPADHHSPDAVLTALIETLSGPPGKERDWQRFRGLFADGAVLVPVLGAPGDRDARRVQSVDRFVEGDGKAVERLGVWLQEHEPHTRVRGSLAMRLSTVEARWESADAEPARGTVCAQLVADGGRWSIVCLSWEGVEARPSPVAISAEARQAATEIFRSVCFTCHGLQGKGDGPAAVALNPKPRDYTDRQWQASVTDDQIRSAILDGVKRSDGKPSMMLPQAGLFEGRPDGTVEAMVALIRALGRAGR